MHVSESVHKHFTKPPYPTPPSPDPPCIKPLPPDDDSCYSLKSDGKNKNRVLFIADHGLGSLDYSTHTSGSFIAITTLTR